MSERERIQALLDEGKISQQEAELLFEALEDDEAPLPPPPQASAPPPPVGNLTWLEADVSAASLTVKVEEGLAEPQVESLGAGESEIGRQGDGWRLKVQGRSGVLGWLGSEHFKVTLRLPSGYGIKLDASAAAVRLPTLPYLKGRASATSLRFDELDGINLDAQATSLKGNLRLSQGEHHLYLSACSAKLALLTGSSVRIQGSSTAGSVTIDGATFKRERDFPGVSERFEGTLGAGTASLTVESQAGSLKFEAPRG